MNNAYICEGVRSPFGRYGGALAGIRPDDLAAQTISALVQSVPDIPAEAIDEVILGCANQAGEDNRNVARMAALLSGLPETVPGVTVNRLCASGAEAIGQAARAIRCGEADIVIAGGVESMTRAPFVIPKSDRAWARAGGMEDTTLGWRFVNPEMDRQHGTHPMPETAENVAREYQISREDQDRFAESSQRRAAHAAESGWFQGEVVPVEVPSKGGLNIVEIDEHPRPDTTLDKLSALRGVVERGGTVTAGNASGINDGAAMVLMASEAAVERHNLRPLARVTGMASAGVPPRVMGIGPVSATQRLLSRLELKLSDFDLIEINEAFASQVIASMRELGVDPMDEAVNPHGGAIALGHPLGASGARLAMSAARDIGASNAERALVTMCVGVGQGVAMSLEPA